MMKKETRIVHIHSSNDEEEEERTPDEEETRIVHISFGELQKTKLLLMNKTQDKFTFIRGMKKSEILMKKETRIGQISFGE